MTDIRRFIRFNSEMQLDGNGDYVLHADHARTLEALRNENGKLRQIISDATGSLPNGAFISPECSVEFMEGLPLEIKLVCSALVSSVAA